MFACTINNIPIPSVPIHNVTYVEAKAVAKAIGVNGVVSDSYFGTPFEDVKGTFVDGDLYIPWYAIARNVKAHHIRNGWDFDVFDNVIAATPFSLTYAYQILFGVNSPGGMVPFQLDTGAFETYLQPSAASELHVVPDGKTYEVGGIGGTETAWEGTIPQLAWGIQTFYNVPCVVSADWTGPNLFGWRMFQDNGYSLIIDRSNFTLDIAKS